MKLKNKYAIGCHVMFYEIEMFKEYIDSCIDILEDISNRKNVTFDFVFNVSEYFETIDKDKINTKTLIHKFKDEMKRLKDLNCNVEYTIKRDCDKIYNIPSYRRDLNYNYCMTHDYILWGETDSLWPKDTLNVIETINNYVSEKGYNRHIITFAYRKMWDDSWKPLEHISMTDLPFKDSKEWNENNPESPKYYMKKSEMNKINNKYNEYDIRTISYPKFDGSCLVISSDVIKSGINIPHSLLLCAEDTSFAKMCRKILGNNYKQFIVKNILRVHNRRHPKKRLYIKNEDNKKGYCDKKGNWWKIIEKMSKYNESILFNSQKRFYTYNDFMKEIK